MESMGRAQGEIAGIQPFAELAQSATTVVYKGYQRGLDRFVLLKVLRPGLGHDEERLRRFEEEARLVAQVQHPNVVVLYAAGRDEGQAYLATEFVDGFDLRGLIAQRPLPPPLAAFVVLEAARGLQAAHAHGILHRDLKPSNILIAQDGQVKLTDFGMASLLEEDAGSEVRGTPGYLAPELVQGAPPTRVSDLFSLGAVFFEALAGHAAFTGADTGALLQAVLHDDPVPRLDRFTDVPAEGRRICARLLAKDPSLRYPDANVLIGDLEAFRAAHGPAEGSAALKTYLDDPEAYARLWRARRIEVAASGPPGAPGGEEEAGPPGSPPRRVSRLRVRWAWALVLLVGSVLLASLLLKKEVPGPPSTDTPDEATAHLPETGDPSSSLREEADTAAAVPTRATAATQPALEQPNLALLTPDNSPRRPLQAEDDTTAHDTAGQVPPDAAAEPAAAEPAAAAGTLAVDAQPWADVYVDGDLVGRTPLAPLTLAAGTHRIGLRHPQFPAYDDEVTIRAGEAAAVRVSLWDLVGRLSIQVSPWAVVVIDGAVRDTIPPQERPFIVQPGLRRLSLRHPDLGVYDTTVTVAPGQAKTLRFNLNTLIKTP